MEKKNYKEIFKFDFKTESEIETFVKNCFYNTIEYYISFEVKPIYNNVLKKLNHIKNLHKDFNKEGIGINEDDYNKVIDGLSEIADKFSHYLGLFNKYITEKQSNCNHKMEEQFYDSHHTYYICRICGKEERD